MSKKIFTVLSSILVASAAFAQTAAPTPQAPTPARPAAAQPAPQPAATPAPAARPTAAPSTTPQNQRVNLNTATDKELDTLPQIGAARSKAIIEARAKARFKNWDDFVARNVVPKNAEDAIKDKVRF